MPVPERLAKLEIEMKNVTQRLDDVKFWVRWVALGIGGVILAAFGNFIIHGGLVANIAATVPTLPGAQ